MNRAPFAYAAGLCVLGTALGRAWQPSAQPAPVRDAAGNFPLRKGDLDCLAVVTAEREDFGVAAPGQELVRHVTFQNITDQEVRLDIVSTTCGCLQAEFDRKAIAPGERATLMLGTAAAPGPGEQAQFVRFSAEWIDRDTPRSEQGICGLRYACATPYVIRPEVLGISGLVGSDASAEVYIHRMEDPSDPPRLSSPRCSLSGWTLERADRPELPPGVAAYRLRGVIGSQTTLDAFIELDDPEGPEGFLRIPVRVRGDWAYRPEGGAPRIALSPGGQQRFVSVTRLIPRVKDLPAPATVILSAPVAGLTARLDGANLVIEVDTQVSSLLGSVRARISAADGRDLVDLPIVWYSPSRLGTR